MHRQNQRQWQRRILGGKIEHNHRRAQPWEIRKMKNRVLFRNMEPMNSIKGYFENMLFTLALSRREKLLFQTGHIHILKRKIKGQEEPHLPNVPVLQCTRLFLMLSKNHDVFHGLEMLFWIFFHQFQSNILSEIGNCNFLFILLGLFQFKGFFFKH